MTENIFNKPITGEINHRTGRAVPQEDHNLLVEAIDAALAVPGVVAIRWDQYTPYFNDGDPCEFSTTEARFKFSDLDEDDDEGDYGDGFHTVWGLTYAGEHGTYPYKPEGSPDFTEDQLAAIQGASHAIEGGQHYQILNELFGDPARVTATPDGFDVEFYDHD